MVRQREVPLVPLPLGRVVVREGVLRRAEARRVAVLRAPPRAGFRPVVPRLDARAPLAPQHDEARRRRDLEHGARVGQPGPVDVADDVGAAHLLERREAPRRDGAARLARRPEQRPVVGRAGQARRRRPRAEAREPRQRVEAAPPRAEADPDLPGRRCGRGPRDRRECWRRGVGLVVDGDEGPRRPFPRPRHGRLAAALDARRALRVELLVGLDRAVVEARGRARLAERLERRGRAEPGLGVAGEGARAARRVAVGLGPEAQLAGDDRPVRQADADALGEARARERRGGLGVLGEGRLVVAGQRELAAGGAELFRGVDGEGVGGWAVGLRHFSKSGLC